VDETDGDVDANAVGPPDDQNVGECRWTDDQPADGECAGS